MVRTNRTPKNLLQMINYYIGLTFFSLIVGLLGIFYRNILKMPNMVFNPLYKILERMVNKGGFLKWIAYPLGYCIYCSTTWIAIIGFLLVYKRITLDILVPIAISHYVAIYFCKHYGGLEEFKTKTEEEKKEPYYKLEHYRGKDIEVCPLGLYTVYWAESPIPSLADIGQLHDGTRWIAPTNWTASKCEPFKAGILDSSLIDVIDFISLVHIEKTKVPLNNRVMSMNDEEFDKYMEGLKS